MFQGTLSIIFEKSSRLEVVSEDRKKANVTPIYEKGLKEDPRNESISLTSVPGKAVEQILLGSITSRVKHVIGKSQHRVSKGKSFLTNLVA